MSEDLNAVEEVVETPEDATEEEIAAVVPEKKAASRGKKFQAEPEAAADTSTELEEVVEVVVPESTPTPVAVTSVVTSGGMSISIRNRK